MPFFAPMPWEADRFYAQPGMKQRNYHLDWYPVGTGAFWLRGEQSQPAHGAGAQPQLSTASAIPTEGMPEDEAAGPAGGRRPSLPFIDRAVYSLEKESIPYWNKFLQGYYDSSGISSDAFDQAIQFSDQGEAA